MTLQDLPPFGSIDVTAYNLSPCGKKSRSVKVMTICDVNLAPAPLIKISSGNTTLDFTWTETPGHMYKLAWYTGNETVNEQEFCKGTVGKCSVSVDHVLRKLGKEEKYIMFKVVMVNRCVQ